jgi:hypothetical protein
MINGYGREAEGGKGREEEEEIEVKKQRPMIDNDKTKAEGHPCSVLRRQFIQQQSFVRGGASFCVNYLFSSWVPAPPSSLLPHSYVLCIVSTIASSFSCFFLPYYIYIYIYIYIFIYLYKYLRIQFEFFHVNRG